MKAPVCVQIRGGPCVASLDITTNYLYIFLYACVCMRVQEWEACTPGQWSASIVIPQELRQGS